jgi:hypothetical protein
MTMMEEGMQIQIEGSVTNPPIMEAARRELSPRFFDEFRQLYVNPTAQQLIDFLNEVRNGTRI